MSKELIEMKQVAVKKLLKNLKDMDNKRSKFYDIMFDSLPEWHDCEEGIEVIGKLKEISNAIEDIREILTPYGKMRLFIELGEETGCQKK
jgi:hypothetical protein